MCWAPMRITLEFNSRHPGNTSSPAEVLFGLRVTLSVFYFANVKPNSKIVEQSTGHPKDPEYISRLTIAAGPSTRAIKALMKNLRANLFSEAKI